MTREFVEDAARFLEEHEVYFLLRDLMKDLIREQPKDPFPFLIEKLQAPKQVLLCMLSPPGLDGDKYLSMFVSVSHWSKCKSIGRLIHYCNLKSVQLY